MRVFNTGTADFWGSSIGEQLRLLRVTNLHYHLAGPVVRVLIEKFAREAMLKCRRFGIWPIIDLRSGMISFVWRGRGEVVISLKGTKISYTPDPIRRSSTVGMLLDLTSLQPGSLDKFVKGCFWHLLEVRP